MSWLQVKKDQQLMDGGNIYILEAEHLEPDQNIQTADDFGVDSLDFCIKQAEAEGLFRDVSDEDNFFPVSNGEVQA